MTSTWFWITECLWLYDYSSRSERPINWSRLVSRGSHSDAETRAGNISVYLLGFRIQCDVKAHFQHNFKFCGALSCFVRERLMSLFIVCQKNVYYRWIAINFSDMQLKKNGKHTTTFHLTSSWKSSLGKIYHGNSTAARTATWNPARATKKTSSYIERPLNPRVNKHGNKAKWLWNTRLS